MKTYFIMKKLRLFFYTFALLWLGCQSDKQDSGSVNQIDAGGQISSIIRNPITAGDVTDTVNVAKMEFEQLVFDFGEVDEGAVVSHVFKFTNTGKAPLLIRSARSTCGCTVPEWPKNPIDAGASGEISVQFNTREKTERQEKPITIIANTIPSETKLRLRGFVHPAQ